MYGIARKSMCGDVNTNRLAVLTCVITNESELEIRFLP